MQLANSAAAVLAALGRRGGVEDADAAAEAMLAAAQAPGIRLAKPGAQGPVRLTKDEVLAAGIEDRRAANAALGQAGAALDGLARAVRTREAEAAAQVRREATEANLRAVREFVLDDGRIGPLLDQHLPGHDGTSQRARLEIRTLVMDQVKHEARAGLRQGGEVRPLDPEGVEGAVRRAIAGSSAAIRRILEKPASEDRLAAELFRGPPRRHHGPRRRQRQPPPRGAAARLLGRRRGLRPAGDPAHRGRARRVAEPGATRPPARHPVRRDAGAAARAAERAPQPFRPGGARRPQHLRGAGAGGARLPRRQATDTTPPQPSVAPISGRQAATLADIEKRA